jgi:Tfp pilus assembly protein PilF
MIDLLAKKTASGNLHINLALQYLRKHEWGLARKALEEGMSKGQLAEPEQADKLFREIHERLFLKE